MALNKSVLKSGLFSAFNSPTSDFRTAARRMAETYYRYASPAIAGGTLVLLPGKQTLLEASLAAALATGRGPPVFGPISVAFSAFWLGATAHGPPGVGLGLVGPAIPLPLQAALLSISSINTSLAAIGKGVSAQTAANQWATALDTWTRTIPWAYTGPPATTGPLT